MCYNHGAKTFIYIKAGEYMSEVIEKFLRYVSVHTTSDDESQTSPSTARQFDLARMLQKEMLEMGIEDAYLDEKYCYVYGHIPANDPENTKTLGFISHMDTAPDASGKDVKPRTIENYDGSEIILNKEKDIKMSPVDFPELLDYKGKSLIVTDGTTLLGSDDKSGIAEIMTMASEIINHPERKHGRIAIAFTPDEEIGVGTAHFDLERFGADFAYTVDGGALGEIEFENFNAAAAVIKVAGRNVHPGEAKNKMVNAASIAMEFEKMLPQNEKPEYTEGYEGFIHLISMEGNTSEAKLQYIVRDHDRAKFEAKKELLKSVASFLNQKYGEGRVTADISDTYYNMREKVEPDYMFLVNGAVEAFKKLDVVPKVVPIRGGTDGAALSYKGLPCPNLCAGGHNFHGIYEYVCVESMEKITEMLGLLACCNFAK